jgi:hypothetical protein
VTTATDKKKSDLEPVVVRISAAEHVALKLNQYVTGASSVGALVLAAARHGAPQIFTAPTQEAIVAATAKASAPVAG